MSKKLEQKQARRLAEEAKKAKQRRGERRRNLVTIGLGLAVAAVVVALVVSDREERASLASDFGPPAADACDQVQEIEDQGTKHVEDGTVVDSYNSNPGTSGPHWQSPSSPGFFPQPVEESQLVHNLEHGQVVVYYSQDLEGDSLESLEAYTQASEGAVIAAPAPEDVSDPIVLAAWNQLQTCAELSSAALNSFREDFQGKAPEQLTPPFSAS